MFSMRRKTEKKPKRIMKILPSRKMFREKGGKRTKMKTIKMSPKGKFPIYITIVDVIK